MASLASALVAAVCVLVVDAHLVAERQFVASSGQQKARQHMLAAVRDAGLAQDTAAEADAQPITRVLELLSRMKAELIAEADKESAMYDKMVCWCEATDKEKTMAIQSAEAKDTQLMAETEGRSARFGQLSQEISQVKQEISDNVQTLKQARAIREQEAAKFREADNELAQSVTNLRNAIAVLAKHQGASLLQLDGPILSSMRVLLRDLALRYQMLVAGRAERGTRQAAFISLVAKARRNEAAGAQGTSSALLDALDAQDLHSMDVLPLKFATRFIANAASPAHRGSRTDNFLQADAQQPIFDSRSSARSSQIYGILNQMLDEFRSELTSLQEDEFKAQQDFTALAAAKDAEITAGRNKLDAMEAEHADNQKLLSDAKEDLQVTREQRSADVNFLQNLKLNCKDLDAQWAERSKTRSAETQAVAEAIAILTKDENRELLAKSISLLQLRAISSSSEVANAKRADAVAVLRRAADSPNFQADDLLEAWHGRAKATVGAAAGPQAQLSTLAMAVQLDSFAKVKAMMDRMMAQLKEQQSGEVKLKEDCVKQLNNNNKTVYVKNSLKQDLEANIDQLASLITNLEGEIGHAENNIATTQIEIKRAGETRELENKEFQSIVTDQRATQSILQQVLTRLKDFYEKGIGQAAFVQRVAQTPPIKFNSYKTNAGGAPVIGLIGQILEDSKSLETETTASEYKAQVEYEQFVMDSNEVLRTLRESITSKTKAVAAARSESAQASEDLANTQVELESLGEIEVDLHRQCDFVLKNFDIRQRARLQEIEAIQAAKAILSGMM